MIAVALPVLQVDFLVGDVEVAAEEKLPLFFAKPIEMRQEGFKKAEFRRLSVVVHGARREVDGNDAEIFQIHPNVASLVVEFRNAETRRHRHNRKARPDGAARIPLARGEVEERFVSGGTADVAREIRVLSLELLKTEHVDVVREEPGKKTLGDGGSDAVGVEGSYGEHGSNQKALE